MSDPGPTAAAGAAPQRRASSSNKPWLFGCGGCATTALGVVTLVVVGVLLAFVRWPGDAVRFEVQLEGAELPASAGVDATYRPEADIPFVTRGILGNSYTTDVQATASTREGWLSVELEDGWRSIRDERLHYVSMQIGSGTVSFSPVTSPPDATPSLRASGYTNLREWAALDGEVATLHTHALFLPTGISYDPAATTVRAIVDVRPIHAARIRPEGQITALPGVAVTAEVRARTSGAGWPGALVADAPAPGTTVEAVIASEAELVTAFGWAVGSTPYMPVDPAMWRALVGRADPRFGLVVEPSSEGATVRFTTPPDASLETEWHLVAVAYAPGETLFGAAEVYLQLESYDDEVFDESELEGE